MVATSKHILHLTMPPTPLNFKSVQPFAAIRDNWDTLKPYHDNYIRTVSFLSVLTGFVGTLALIIKHGFRFPILHPMMAEDIEPDKELEHPNEYVTEEDLVEAKLFEFEQEERWRLAKEMEMKEQQERERQKEEENQPIEPIIWEERGEDPVTKEAEEGLQEQLQDGAENAMDALDDENVFDVNSDES